MTLCGAARYIKTPYSLLLDVGYCQGMTNDLLARFLAVTDSEVDSYWMFSSHITWTRRDQHSLRSQ